METNETLDPEKMDTPTPEVVEDPIVTEPGELVDDLAQEQSPTGQTYTLTREQMDAMELTAKQLAAATEQYTRLGAEYENYRKRTAKEKETIYQDAKADTITPFLAVYDNFERALAADGDSESPHRKGIEMMHNQCKEVLLKLGVTEMDCKGQPFNPERHNAVMHIDDEALGENVVASVFQIGRASCRERVSSPV